MSTPPTQEQADNLKALADNIEVIWRTLQRSKRALSVLTNAGRATCTDVLTYNQQVEYTYTYQRTLADLIKLNGGSPPSVPLPLYVAWKGKTGDAALRVDCATAQLSGAQPTGSGDYYVGADKVEWVTAETQASKNAIDEVMARARAQAAGQRQPGQLGFPFVAAALFVLIVGVTVAIAAVAIRPIVDALSGVSARKEQSRQVAVTAERHAATLEARSKCYDDCLAKGKEPTICARDCSRLNPVFTPPAWATGGLFGKVLIGAVIIGVGFVGYKLYKNGTFDGLFEGGGGDTAPAGTSGYLSDGDYEDDVDYENAIDV